jgi:hypothetical protein
MITPSIARGRPRFASRPRSYYPVPKRLTITIFRAIFASERSYCHKDKTSSELVGSGMAI